MAGIFVMPMFVAPATQPADQKSAPALVQLDERVTYLVAGEPQNHLVQAHEAMKRKDNRVAADELRIASDYVDTIRSKHGDDVDVALSHCVDNLRSFAATTLLGQAIPPEAVNATFAETNRTLAEHFRGELGAAMHDGQHVRAGYALRHCASSLRQAVIWSAGRPNEGVLESTDDALEVASALISESDDASKKLSENPPSTQPTAASHFQPADVGIDERVRELAQALGRHIDLIAQLDEAQTAAEKQPPRSDK